MIIIFSYYLSGNLNSTYVMPSRKKRPEIEHRMRSHLRCIILYIGIGMKWNETLHFLSVPLHSNSKALTGMDINDSRGWNGQPTANLWFMRILQHFSNVIIVSTATIATRFQIQIEKEVCRKRGEWTLFEHVICICTWAKEAKKENARFAAWIIVIGKVQGHQVPSHNIHVYSFYINAIGHIYVQRSRYFARFDLKMLRDVATVTTANFLLLPSKMKLGVSLQYH